MIKATSFYGENIITVTNEETSLIIGHRNNGAVRVNAQITNRQLVMTYSGVSAATIDSIGYFVMMKLSTAERSYNEFKF